ncbi:hypothetical protein DFH08DRAFT_1083911 [Mycena albidolilacea]|uniref:Uncharacterized protein n=1 Tax=Mycena albidolilacea TaxID=1033008 RepID=A0AAD6ZNR0_9AGAR|nr:hypothetical protein DFH08DRAFT_1083911 [Mycena albidolilacea]
MFSRLHSLFFAPTPPPADVRVVPCTGIDAAPRQLVVTTGFIFDARLDTKKLEDTLALLVERKFPRAGARLALRNGSYEFHIPNTFDAQTPAVAFTAADHCEPYASSTRPPVQHLLNASSSEPWICSSPLLVPYFRSHSCPASLEAFLVPNTPLIHVHVTVFDDLTFLGITSTHITFDALGISTLMHGWQRVLAGNALEDIPGMPWDIAPFATFTTPAPGPMCHRGWFDLGVLAKFAFIVCLVWRILRDRNEEHKVVRVPKAFLEQKKSEIMGKLKAAGSKEWVGSSDVLMAWWFKTSYAHRTDATPLHIHLSVNLREMRIFPGAPGTNELAPISTPFINNAVLSISMPPLTVNTLRDMSLRDLALRIRRVINTYKDDLDGIAADVRSCCAQSLTVFPHPAGAEYTLQSNLRKGGFGELDFSGASVGEAGLKLRARVRYATAFPSGPGIPLRGTGMVLFEDEQAIWMNQTRGAKDWERLKKAGELEFI